MTTIFTSYEKLFASWIMHHKLNDVIEAEPRFPKCDQDLVCDSYYTIPKKMPAPKKLDDNELVKLCQRRVAFYKNNQIFQRKESKVDNTIRQAQPSPGDRTETNNGNVDDTTQQVQQKEQPEPIYSFVNGLEVQAIEKSSVAEEVKYGDFWGRTYFVTTTQQTGYFLIDGWLVVSIPKEETNEEPFELDSDDTMTIYHKFDVAEDPVSDAVMSKVHTWFGLQREKLSEALKVSFGIAFLQLLSVIALSNQPMVAAHVLSRVFLVASFAMQSLSLYIGFQLYRLYQLEEKMSGVNNLGDWVKTVRVCAGKYPKLSEEAPIDKFFTPREQQFLNHHRIQATKA
ncbi:MAG TPA: hypothetical protein VHK67_07900 [Rhabdochlamydiaceae bacterium]|jgi:hypothetical protein|nr:hypothetical protein [Rhabdochlamydiaceae bacterium]